MFTRLLQPQIPAHSTYRLNGLIYPTNERSVLFIVQIEYYQGPRLLFDTSKNPQRTPISIMDLECHNVNEPLESLA